MIDWDRVATLREEVGDDCFDEVVSLFLEEVDAVILRLHTAPDPTRLEGDLHFLKGGALNLGFHDLGLLCQTGERLAASGQAAQVDLQAVIALYAASRQAFLEQAPRAAAA